MENIKFPTFRKDYLDKYLAQIFSLYIFKKLKHVVTELDKKVQNCVPELRRGRLKP